MDFIGFIINLLLFITFAFVVYTKTGNNKSKLSNIISRNYLKIMLTAEIISAVLLLSDITNIVDFGGYKLLSLWNILFGGVIFLFFRFQEKIPQKFKSIFGFLSRSITICLALELFVFNLNSAHLFLDDYPVETLSINAANIENFDTLNMTNIENGTSYLEFLNVNKNIGTITFKAESNQKGFVNFNVDMSDETNSADYRYNIASAQVIKDNEKSETVVCNFSGEVSKIRFSFNTAENEIITLKSITINNPVELHFSAWRFLIMLFGCLIIYTLAFSVVFKRNFSDSKKAVKAIAYTFTGTLLIITLILANTSRYTDPEHSLKKDFTQTTGNQITQTIVDAFANGRTDMDIEMNQQLLELENPYDWSQRETGQIGAYPWDHLLFNGKYYSYYGIAPVLTLFLPYYLITGHYFPSVWAVWLFGALGILFLTKFYLCFMEKFFKGTRSSLVLMGLAIIQFSSGIWFCFNVPNFYEIAQTSGFLCATAGAFFLISSNVIGDGKIKKWRVAMSSVCFSLGVLCRPTLAVYCIAALFFIYAGFRKKKKDYSGIKISKTRYYLPYWLNALVPFILIGSIQIFYNYARFGNPFDFGIQYSLTINDFLSSQYHTHFSLIGFFNYLFAIPAFNINFPFFNTSEVFTFNPQGYYFIATYSALGILWKSLPILSYGKSIRAYRLCENKDKKLYSLLMFIVCIACPFAIIFSIWESGYGARYCVDFSWQLIIGALIIAFIIFEKCKSNMKTHLNKLMVCSTVISLVLNFAQIYNWIKVESSLSLDWQASALSFARLFEFWK